MTNTTDHRFDITVILGEDRGDMGNITMLTDHIPSVGDVLDMDPGGAYEVTRIEHHVSTDDSSRYVLRKTYVKCRRWLDKKTAVRKV